VDRIRRNAELLAERLRRAAVYAEQSRAAQFAGSRVDTGQSLAVRLASEVGALGRQLTDAVEQVERELDEVRGRAERLRLVPAARIFTALHRSVRDVAEAQSKRVAFDGRGGELRLDPHVLSQVGGALLHVVRNAVAHGIEPELDRRAAGKPAEGYVTVTVERRGRYAAFTCVDDGRGFDLDAVRRAAEASGLAAPPDADSKALLDLVMRGGVSTAESVTGVSGRGIGLNAVRDVAEQLGGQTSVRTEPGAGTTVELVVPLSLVAVHGLVVRASGTTASLPLDAVRSCVRLTADELATATTAAAMPHDGQAIPFLPLYEPLSLRPTNGTASAVAVVMNAGAGSAAIGVDELLGTSTLVVRPLPALAPADPVVAGVCVDAEGNPQVVLDPHALVAAAVSGSTGTQAPNESGDQAGEPVLVVDDSLTTRMLERSILESAGYEVDTAASGEEGLAKAGQRKYALFLVDIDMPGIDGFTFVERTRADPVLQDTPAILVSSRSSTEDKRRGAAVGASAYVVKSEFNQEELLEHITRLVRA
jgi:two-component system chemotaxis sensor kinase CheA